jgi:hypothetical protein
MFTETTGDSNAGKMRKWRYLTLSFIALAFAFQMYPSKAQAQLAGAIEANIPFDFQVGNAKLPAGKYIIHALDDSELKLMEIRSADGSTSALFEVQPAVAKSVPTKSELIFNKYGDRYFLAELFDEGSTSGSELPKSRYEKKISPVPTEPQAHVVAHH